MLLDFIGLGFGFGGQPLQTSRRGCKPVSGQPRITAPARPSFHYFASFAEIPVIPHEMGGKAVNPKTKVECWIVEENH
jgi:hypothetical protein